MLVHIIYCAYGSGMLQHAYCVWPYTVVIIQSDFISSGYQQTSLYIHVLLWLRQQACGGFPNGNADHARSEINTMASNNVSKYNFIAEPDSALECVICLDVAEDPRQHEECGRLLCKECLEKYGRDKPCPNCRMKQPQYFKDNKS